MSTGENRRPIWLRLPRGAYWALGAAVAFSGAYVARKLSEDEPLIERMPYWLAGSAIIFIGLWILSLGTRARLHKRDSRTPSDKP